MALGAGLELHCGGTMRCRGNLHLLGIAESGTGKSEATKTIFAPLHALQRARLEEWESTERPMQKARVAGFKSREKDVERNAAKLASIIHSREVAERGASDGARPLLFASNVTREALAAALAHAPGQAFAVLNPDARGLLGIIAGKYSSGRASDEDIYLAGFSGDAMSSLRIGSGFVHLHSPCLTTCLLIQPDCFDNLRSKAIFAESGWLQRNLVFDSHAGFGPLPALPATVPDDVAGAWEEHVTALVEQVRDSGETATVTPCAAASALMLERANAIRRRIAEGDLKDAASFACRWPEQANRIALNLHAARHGDPADATATPLSAATMEQAWALAEWFAQEQTRLLAGLREDKRYARCEHLVKILSRQGVKGQMPRWRLVDNGFQEDELMLLARLYPSRLQVSDVPAGSKGGRPQKWIKAL
jgi:hypothetical protein